MLTDRQTDICYSRVAFGTEKSTGIFSYFFYRTAAWCVGPCVYVPAADGGVDNLLGCSFSTSEKQKYKTHNFMTVTYIHTYQEI